MPRVVPSQVVAYIDDIFPWAKKGEVGRIIGSANSAIITALLELIDQIPPELIVLRPDRYSEYVQTVARVRIALKTWRRTKAHSGISDEPKGHPIALLRNLLADCPNEFPSTDANRLDFIDDAELRGALGVDIAATNSALSNAEWKAATVLAGSVIEALLLWKLRSLSESAVATARDKAIAADRAPRSTPKASDLDDWRLNHLVDVVATLDVLAPETVTELDLARNFRNLIHPGRERRLGQKCDRGTALAAVAVLEHVVRDLTAASSKPSP